jgi:tetratricopeptide (TPR) repeat protein
MLTGPFARIFNGWSGARKWDQSLSEKKIILNEISHQEKEKNMFNGLRGAIAKSKVGQNNLLMDMSDLKNAKTKVDVNLETNITDIETQLESGKLLFSSFLETANYGLLKKCAAIFFEVMEKKPSRVEPYTYIAAIYLAFEQIDDAIKYYIMAKNINPGFPLVMDLKNMLLINN